MQNEYGSHVPLLECRKSGIVGRMGERGKGSKRAFIKYREEEMSAILGNGRKSWLVMVGSVIILILVITMFAKLGFAQSNLIHGRAVYGANCAKCHGEYGKGDGPRGAELQPKPRDFTDPKGMEMIPPEKFERSVVEGLPSRPDHTFGHLLTAEEVRDVAHYIESLIR